MELGRLSIEPRDVAIAPEIQQIVRNLATTTEIHTLNADCAEALIVSVDPIRFWQVLQNLITNAIRYSPDGGEIDVRGEVDPEVPTRARISVRDRGVGIADDQIDRVFEKFYRVDGELKARVRGTGLGLAICQAIVESHGGQIWVESVVGEGSTFFFTLPLVRA
jgi:signal transduction histidine kinase